MLGIEDLCIDTKHNHTRGNKGLNPSAFFNCIYLLCCVAYEFLFLNVFKKYLLRSKSARVAQQRQSCFSYHSSAPNAAAGQTDTLILRLLWTKIIGLLPLANSHHYWRLQKFSHFLPNSIAAQRTAHTVHTHTKVFYFPACIYKPTWLK